MCLVDPVGRSFVRDGRLHRVVGVAANIKTRSVGEAERPCVYLPFTGVIRAEAIPFGMTVAVQTEADSAAMVRQCARRCGK